MIYDAPGALGIVPFEVAVEFMDTLNNAVPAICFRLSLSVPAADCHYIVGYCYVMAHVRRPGRRRACGGVGLRREIEAEISAEAIQEDIALPILRRVLQR
jgi:hypothetical protein